MRIFTQSCKNVNGTCTLVHLVHCAKLDTDVS